MAKELADRFTADGIDLAKVTLRAPRRPALCRPGLRAARALPRRHDRRGGARQGVRGLPRGAPAASTAITSPIEPIEIVNLRLVGAANAAKIAKPTAPAGKSLDAARVRTGHLHLPRRRQARRLSDRLLPPRPAAGRRRRIAGPAIVLQMDITTVVPPQLQLRSRRRRQPDHPKDAGDAMHEHDRTSVSLRPSPTASTRSPPRVIQGALENIAIEMGYKLMRMSYSSIIRESEDFGAALVDAEGRGLAESAQSTPLQSGPDPGLHARHPEASLEERGETIRPGDVDHAQRRLCRRQPRPGRRLLRAGVRRRPADRLCRHHRAPSRHRRAVARLLRHRRGDRRLCRGPAVQGDQGLRPRREERRGLADRARQHPRLRPRGRRHGGPGRGRADRRRAHGRAGRALRPRDLRPGLRGADGSRRAADAPGDRQAARRRLPRRDGDRRLSRQPTIRQEGAADRRHHHQEGRQPDRSTSPARRRRCPTGRSTCRSKAPSTSRSGSPSARCCSTPQSTATSR